MNKKVNIAVIGAGWWCTEFHLPYLSSLNHVNILSVCRFGKKELNLIINKAHKEGVFGVPSYVIKDELFWGREQLPMIKARLTRDYSKLI